MILISVIYLMEPIKLILHSSYWRVIYITKDQSILFQMNFWANWFELVKLSQWVNFALQATTQSQTAEESRSKEITNKHKDNTKKKRKISLCSHLSAASSV